MTGKAREPHQPPARQALVLNVVGLVLLAAGWAAVSGKVTLADQAPYLNLSVAGILLAGIGNALYLMATRRTLEMRLRRIHHRIPVIWGDTPRPPASGVTGS
jgi:protein-S-isoprenylcysteine O-methyltransferase Ste14